MEVGGEREMKRFFLMVMLFLPFLEPDLRIITIIPGPRLIYFSILIAGSREMMVRETGVLLQISAGIYSTPFLSNRTYGFLWNFTAMKKLRDCLTHELHTIMPARE